jgi:hypothetical protein
VRTQKKGGTSLTFFVAAKISTAAGDIAEGVAGESTSRKLLFVRWVLLNQRDCWEQHVLVVLSASERQQLGSDGKCRPPITTLRQTPAITMCSPPDARHPLAPHERRALGSYIAVSCWLLDWTDVFPVSWSEGNGSRLVAPSDQVY